MNKHKSDSSVQQTAETYARIGEVKGAQLN